jgi:hypothetical protein
MPAVTCRHRQAWHSNCELPRYYHQTSFPTVEPQPPRQACRAASPPTAGIGPAHTLPRTIAGKHPTFFGRARLRHVAAMRAPREQVSEALPRCVGARRGPADDLSESRGRAAGWLASTASNANRRCESSWLDRTTSVGRGDHRVTGHVTHNGGGRYA